MDSSGTLDWAKGLLPVSRWTWGGARGIKCNCIQSLGGSLGSFLLTFWGLFELGLGVLPFGSPSLAGPCSPSDRPCLSCFPVSLTRALPASSLHSCQSHLCPTQPASKTDHHYDPLCNPVQASGHPAQSPSPPVWSP